MSRPRGGALQNLAQELARAAEGTGTSPPAPPPQRVRNAGAELQLGPAALQAIAAAVQSAMSRAQPAPAREGADAAAAMAQLGDRLVAEVRTLVDNLGSPAQATAVGVKKARRYELGASTSREKVTQGVYALLLKHGLQHKPSNDEVADILAAASGEKAPEADVELSKQNIHACVVKDCENLRSSLKRNLRGADNLPAMWVKKGGVTVGGAGAQLPSFPGEADVELQVTVLRCVYMALPEHFRRAKNAMDADAPTWKTKIGLTAEGIRTAFSAAAALWDGRRDGKEVQENAANVGANGEPPGVAAWVVPQARDGRANKRTKRQSGLTATFGLDLTNTRALMLEGGAQ